MKPHAKISSWRISSWNPNEHVLIGHITDHPNQERFKAEKQLTSQLIRIDFVNRTAETENTLYTLL